MIRTLRLVNFKNFHDATLPLGEMTLLVGTNASGKSNLRDAFRFLHGISRRYALAEIIGEKWIEGGVLQWKGMRGGTRETAYQAGSGFRIEATLRDGDKYCIEIDVGLGGKPPRVTRESLWTGWSMVFDSHPVDDPPDQEANSAYLFVRLPRGGSYRKVGKRLRFLSTQPVVSQMADHGEATKLAKECCEKVISALASMRFLDLSPEACRIPSLPGQTILGDRGENLSSVLQAICLSESAKKAMLEWLKELTPLDVAELEFVPDQTGRVLATLIEQSGQRTSAYSASDGTLRFLAVLAALMGPAPARFYFFEELENGIHPTRLHLLLQLIEQKTTDGRIQVVATSHSPQLLGFLGEKVRESAVLVHRFTNRPDAGITRILDIPGVEEILMKQDIGRLFASGWLEDAVAFLEKDGDTG